MLDDTLNLSSFDEQFLSSKSKSHLTYKEKELPFEQLLRDLDKIEDPTSSKSKTKLSKKKKPKSFKPLHIPIPTEPDNEYDSQLHHHIPENITKIRIKKTTMTPRAREYSKEPSFSIAAVCQTEPDRGESHYTLKKLNSDYITTETDLRLSSTRNTTHSHLIKNRDSEGMHLHLDSYEENPNPRVVYRHPLLQKKSKTTQESTKDSHNSSGITLPAILSPANYKIGRSDERVYDFQAIIPSSNSHRTRENCQTPKRNNISGIVLPKLSNSSSLLNPQFNVEVKPRSEYHPQSSYKQEDTGNKLLNFRHKSPMSIVTRREPAQHSNPLMKFIDSEAYQSIDNSPRLHSLAFHDQGSELSMHGSDYALKNILGQRSPRAEGSNSGSDNSPFSTKGGVPTAFGFEFASNYANEQQRKRIGKKESNYSTFKKGAEFELHKPVYNI